MSKPTNNPLDNKDKLDLNVLVPGFITAGRTKELSHLLSLETSDKKNALFDRYEKLGQTEVFVRDVTSALRYTQSLSQGYADRDQPSPFLGEEIQYLLLLSAIRSRADTIPFKLVRVLVSHKRWTPVQALAYIRQKTDVWERAFALSQIVPCLPQALRKQTLEEAFATALSLEDPISRDEALAEATVCQAALGQLREAQAWVERIEDEFARAKALIGILEYHPNKQCEQPLSEWIGSVHRMQNKYCRGMVMAKWAIRLASLSQTEEALEIAHGIAEGYFCVEALMGIARQLPASSEETILTEAVTATESCGNPVREAHALQNIAARLAELGQVQEALDLARAIKDKEYHVRALGGIAVHLTEPLRQQVLQEAFSVAESIEDPYSWAEVIADVAVQQGNVTDVSQTFSMIKEIPEKFRGEALGKIAVRRAQCGFYEEALSAARLILFHDLFAATLADIIPYLPSPLQKGALDEALARVITIKDESPQTELFKGLSSFLPEPTRRQALIEATRTARAIQAEHDFYVNQSWRNKKLIDIALEQARHGYFNDALDSLEEVYDLDNHQAEGWIKLLPLAPEPMRIPLLDKAKLTTAAVRDPYYRAMSLASLSMHLSEVSQTEILEHAQEIATTLRDETPDEQNHRSSAVRHVAICWAKMGKFQQAAAVVQKEVRSHHQVAALIALVPHLDQTWRHKLLAKALAISQTIKDENKYIHVLGGICIQMAASGLIDEALVLAKTIQSNPESGLVLQRLALILPEPLRQNLLEELLRSANTNTGRDRLLCDISICKAQLGDVQEAIHCVNKIGSEPSHIEALLGVINASAHKPYSICYSIWNQWSRIDLGRGGVLHDLLELLPTIMKLGEPFVAEQIFHVVRRSVVWWP